MRAGEEDIEPGALYHLATGDEWLRYQEAGVIAPASLEGEGFIHCSWGDQVAGTVDKHFAGVTDLLALVVDAAALPADALVEEDSYGSGQRFPHIYQPIPVSAIRGEVRLR